VRKRILLALAGSGLLVLLLALVAVYWATQQVPEFYETALRVDPAKQVEASDQMLQQATALASDVKNKRQWRTLFTAEQINGWLAVDLPKNHASSLPPEVSDPRVQIQPEELTLACRYEGHGVKTVLSLSVDLYLAKPNVVALRIKKARAGQLPLPLDKVLDTVSQVASHLDLPLHWQQEDGDPVALVTIPPQRGNDDKLIHIESLALADGEIYLAGSTESSKD